MERGTGNRERGMQDSIDLRHPYPIAKTTRAGTQAVVEAEQKTVSDKSNRDGASASK